MSDQKLSLMLSNRKWRLNNLYYIIDKNGNKVLFKMNWAQEELFDGLHHWNLVLKARQLGFTTFIDILLLDHSLFNSNTRAGIIAHSKDDAAKIFKDKIKFPYDNLPEILKEKLQGQTDKTGELQFSNNSNISVATSFRSGTLQLLHVSEFGKICAKYPEKAKEIVTGAFNAVSPTGTVFIESTAEGRTGYFYDYCEKSRAAKRSGKALSSLDFKFFFFPWYGAPEYRIDSKGILLPDAIEEYFDNLKAEHRIDINQDQKAWYFKKWESLGEDVKREFPSTPDEAFSQSIEGAYYGKIIAKIEGEKQIGLLPVEPSLLVCTAFDLGMDDSTTIWFYQQDMTGALRIVDYYENSGEGIPFYVDILNEKGYNYGTHYLPHDVMVKELSEGKTRLSKFHSLGIKNTEVVKRGSILDGIEEVRATLPKCWFSENKTFDGLNALKNYRKDWDEGLGTFKKNPLHDWSSHAADAFRTLVMGLRQVRTKSSGSYQRQAYNKHRSKRRK